MLYKSQPCDSRHPIICTFDFLLHLNFFVTLNRHHRLRCINGILRNLKYETMSQLFFFFCFVTSVFSFEFLIGTEFSINSRVLSSYCTVFFIVFSGEHYHDGQNISTEYQSVYTIRFLFANLHDSIFECATEQWT